MADEPLLSSGLLKKLEGHELTSPRLFSGGLTGERHSRQRGGGLEFADYKAYTPGDDFRYVDWNAYARNDHLLIKLFETTENLATHVLLDVSSSMDFGSPTKLLCVQRLAAALAYLALCREDRLAVYPFSDQLQPGIVSLKGRGQASPVFGFIRDQRPLGVTNLDRVLHQFTREATAGGLLFILSDFWDLSGFQRGVRHLFYNNFVVCAVQILTPEEVLPEYAGELDLIDAETGERAFVTIKKGTLERYREALEASFRQLEALLAGSKASFFRVSTSDSVEDVLLHRFRREGLVR